MSAESGEEFVTAFERLKQVERGNGSPGAMAFAVLSADHECRPVSALDYSRGGNSDDTTMPAIAVENYASRVGKLWFFESLFERLHDLLLALLAIGVELIEPCCQITGFVFFSCFEKFDYSLRNIHAPSGVHARRDSEGHVRSGELPLFVP